MAAHSHYDDNASTDHSCRSRKKKERKEEESVILKSSLININLVLTENISRYIFRGNGGVKNWHRPAASRERRCEEVGGVGCETHYHCREGSFDWM